MTLIPGIIPQQNFERIRDRIGVILFQELENQWLRTGDSDLRKPLSQGETDADADGIPVWNERIVPFDQAEMPCINVGYNGAPFENNNPLWSEGVNTFFIDVYCSAAATPETEADTLAAHKLQKIIGKIRFILRHSFYRTLGFAPGFIGGTRIASIEIADPKATQDANGCVMGRLIFEVKATEDVTPLEPVDASNFMTTVTLFESDKGYVWIGDY
jgi:hypothetical protein